MPYFSSEPRSPGGYTHPLLGKAGGLRLQSDRLPRPSCQPLWNDPTPAWESSLGAKWVAVSHLSPTALLIMGLLGAVHEKKTLHFCKECFSWWHPSPGVKAGPGELCMLELDTFQKCLQMLFWVWVSTPDLGGCLGRGGQCWQKHQDSVLGINFIPFRANLKEHLGASCFVTDKKVNPGKSIYLFLKKCYINTKKHTECGFTLGYCYFSFIWPKVIQDIVSCGEKLLNPQSLWVLIPHSTNLLEFWSC